MAIEMTISEISKMNVILIEDETAKNLMVAASVKEIAVVKDVADVVTLAFRVAEDVADVVIFGGDGRPYFL